MNLNYNYDNKIVKWNNNINLDINYLNNINNNFNKKNNLILNNYDLIFINNIEFYNNLELFKYNIEKSYSLSKNRSVIIINDLEDDDMAYFSKLAEEN